ILGACETGNGKQLRNSQMRQHRGDLPELAESLRRHNEPVDPVYRLEVIVPQVIPDVDLDIPASHRVTLLQQLDLDENPCGEATAKIARERSRETRLGDEDTQLFLHESWSQMRRQAGYRPEDCQACEDPATAVATHVAHALVGTVAGLNQPRPDNVE